MKPLMMLVLALCIAAFLSGDVTARIIKVIEKNDVIEIDIEDTPKSSSAANSAEEAAMSNPEEETCKEAKPCDPSKCKLPHCRCSGKDIPGGIEPSKTPQLVSLTFSYAVRAEDMHFYRKLFHNKTNPNGCPATGTFFVSHGSTDYVETRRLYSERHEIGNHGVEEKSVPWWTNATSGQWAAQIRGQNTLLQSLAGIKRADIRGFRTPNLYMGGDKMMKALTSCKMTYDATRDALNYKEKPNLLWPYTYDFQSTQDCPIGVCPKCSYPGFWQVPLQALVDSRGYPCADLQGCFAETEQQMFDILVNGFKERYTSNRAPMMLQISQALLLTPYKMNALVRFVEYVNCQKDAYLVSAWQTIKWTTSPTCDPCHPDPKPLRCDDPVPKPCSVYETTTCNYDKDGKFVPGGSPGIIKVMKICNSRCPHCYPTLKDPLGDHC